MNNFKDYYFRRYAVRKWSFQHFFCIFIYFLIFALPFYFAFGGTNFWFSEKFDLLELEYTFTGYYALEVSLLDMNSNNSVLQFSNIPGSSMSSLVGLTTSFDDTTDNLTALLTFTQINEDEILSFNGALFYTINVPALDLAISVPYTFSLTNNILNAQIIGQMKLANSEPINALSTLDSEIINRAAYLTTNMRAPLTFSQIIEAQFDNPYRLEGETFSSVTYNSAGSISSRTIKLRLEKDTSAVLPYYPPMLETLKFNFSRYVGFLIFSYLLLRGIMLILIKDEGLECNIKDQKIPVK